MKMLAPKQLLHTMVPEHFHASRLFRRLVADPAPSMATSTSSSAMVEGWQVTYLNMYDAQTDIDYFSTPMSSRTVSPPLPTATPPPSPFANAADLKVEETSAGDEEDVVREGEQDADANVFQETYWRSDVDSTADLHAMVATMVLWDFDVIPEFVWRFCESSTVLWTDVDNKFTRMLKLHFKEAEAEAEAEEEALPTSVSPPRASPSTIAVATWAQAYPHDSMENKQYETLALLRRRDLRADHVISILELLVQDRDARLVAALLRLQTLPLALPFSVHQYLSEFHGTAIALCALRNPHLGNPQQTVALATSAMSALIAAGRRRMGGPKTLHENRDDMWVAAAAHSERAVLLQRFMDVGADPCNDTDRLALALCGPSSSTDPDEDTRLVMRVVDYHGCGGTWPVWSRAAVRIGNRRLLMAFMGRLEKVTRDDDDDDLVTRLENLVELCVAAGNSDCLAYLLAWSSEFGGAAFLRRKAARASCRLSDELCLREVHRSCEEFQFTVEDTDAVFLAVVEKAAQEKWTGAELNAAFRATVLPYVFVRARHAHVPQRPLMLSSVAKFLLAWA